MVLKSQQYVTLFRRLKLGCQLSLMPPNLILFTANIVLVQLKLCPTLIG